MRIPNWCSNHITVRGTNSAEIKRLADAFTAGEFCNAVIPIPEALHIVSGFVGAKGTPAQDALEAKEQANLAAYGYRTWYDFCVHEWGTKWDFGADGSLELDEDGLGFSGTFESSWSPPINIAEALTEQGMEVTLYYCEPGMCFVGKWEDGNDDYYEYGGEKSTTVRAAIGDELDDMFGISESMAEYEAENPEEDLTEWLREGVEATK